MPGNTKKHRRGNGEGSVYQRKDGTWAAVLTVGVKPDGKPDRSGTYIFIQDNEVFIYLILFSL